MKKKVKLLGEKIVGRGTWLRRLFPKYRWIQVRRRIRKKKNDPTKANNQLSV